MGSLSEKQEALVKETWELMKQDIPKHSLRFFTIILEIAPSAKDMFSFLKDSDEIPENNPKLKAHAVNVFKMTCEASIQLREKKEVIVGDKTLTHLGSVHRQKGVSDLHFEVVKDALLRTIKEASAEKWNDDLCNAWTQAYHHLSLAILNEMK